MASKSAERKEPVTRGTGNVFADLGFPNADERQAKLRLAYTLNQVLEGRKLSQADAAKVLERLRAYRPDDKRVLGRLADLYLQIEQRSPAPDEGRI